jgi:hypothetical protein
MSVLDLNMVIDGIPYEIKAVPFQFNSEKRYRVDYGGVEYIFAYDSEIGKYASIDGDASGLPDTLEMAVADKLAVQKA